MDSRLDAIRNAPTILGAIHASMSLPARASAPLASRSRIEALEAAIDDPADQLTAIGAVHVLARELDPHAADRIVERLQDPRPFIKEHAVWVLGSMPLPQVDARAVGGVIELVRVGGLAGMLAQLSLERLARRHPSSAGWTDGLRHAIDHESDPTVRARLVQTIGLLDHGAATAELRRISVLVDEDEMVRIAAVAALGERPAGDTWETVLGLSRDDGPIGATARLAAHDMFGIGPHQGPRPTGQRIAHVYLHAALDPELTTAGMGETGGIATLLVRLGDSLVRQPGIASVTTISRGPADRVVAGLSQPDDHRFAAVPIGEGVPAGIAHAWPGLIDARRGIRRILRSQRPIDRLHLRMADVGSLAGSLAARDEGVRTVFSLAPDPHALIAAAERAGTLSRADFGLADGDAHLWFRVALVRHLVQHAAEVVLFPRPELREQLRDLVGVDIATDARRYTVVPEGIDTSGIEAAEADPVRAWPDVDAILSRIPAGRRDLPLVISVGRMHEVKGMARVAAAWAGDATLSTTTNLIIVGGDLENPSQDEAAELERIKAVLGSSAADASALVLAGHQANRTVSRLLVVAARGHRGSAAAGGAYVCASRKEEFGLAIVEALAAGLPVVVPRIGGPATYVEDGSTGILVDTGDPTAIASGLAQALALAPDTVRAQRARDLVRGKFTIDAMARTMAAVYGRPVTGTSRHPEIAPIEHAALPVVFVA
jgi:glycosyltransferase involved in cell wall biosynthesis